MSVRGGDQCPGRKQVGMVVAAALSHLLLDLLHHCGHR